MTVIRFVGDGKNYPSIKVSVSMNNARSWQEKNLLPGQSFTIPPNVTNLLLNNIPYDAKGSYEIRQGKICRV